jgi:hypothetical protein
MAVGLRLIARVCLATVALIALGVVVSLAACGGSTSTQTSSKSAIVGYWAMPASRHQLPNQVFEVVRAGGGYLVGWNGRTPMNVPSTGTTLLLQKGRTTSKGVRLATIHLVLDGRSLTLISTDWSSGHLLRRIAMSPLSKAGYLAGVDAFHKWQLETSVTYLAQMVGYWANGHGGVYPQPSEVTPDGALGSAIKRAFQSGWLSNPYTGRPMEPGTAPGDYTYTSSGSHFELVGHLLGGQSYILRTSGVPKDVRVTGF